MGSMDHWACFDSIGELRIRTGHDLSLRMAIVWVPFVIGYFAIHSDFTPPSDRINSQPPKNQCHLLHILPKPRAICMIFGNKKQEGQ